MLMRSKGSSRLSSSSSQWMKAIGIRSEKGEVTEEQVVAGSSDPSFTFTVRSKPIKIVVKNMISSVAFLADGQQFLSGGKDGKIQCWQTKDGEEVGEPMDAGSSAVSCLATSQDGKWIAAGMETGGVFVWENWKELGWFTCGERVSSVDISSDGTKIAMTFKDGLDLRLFPYGEWLRRWTRDFHTVKFSPDGFLLAIGSEQGDSSIYDIRGGKTCSISRISIRSVSWVSDSKQLFVLSCDGNIHCLDAYSGATLSQWSVHSNDNPTCHISLSSNGIFIAASANSSVSFWDTSTHEKIGSVIHLPDSVNSMAISPNNDLVIAGNSTILLWDLFNVFSTPSNRVSEPAILGLYS